MQRRWTRLVLSCVSIVLVLSVFGCAHYPVNQPLAQVDPGSGYRGRFWHDEKKSDDIFLFLAFSGGGTRAAALSYGLLESLRDTEVTLNGKKTRLLDQVDGISGVSGGSFTAAYYGLFGDRIFEDFESKFLKKNIQGTLTARMFLNPYNWVRLLSPTVGRSDLAAEYYDTHIFEGKTFGDIAARKGPMILVNATDMVTGIRLAFNQDSFDVICTDVAKFPVARAVAASSAVPVVLTPITLKNYAGSCGFTLPPRIQKILDEQETGTRAYHHVNNMRPYLDGKETPYIHLVDGGVSDNLGLRAVLDRMYLYGDFWSALKAFKIENTRKVVFILVNAETELKRDVSLFDKMPGFGFMLASYSSIAITRYNFETVMLLRDSFERWTREVQEGRCSGGQISTEPGGCGDIKFYLIEVKFDALKDEKEREYYKSLPTSFHLSDEEVDKLRQKASEILRSSPEFQELMRDLK
ncbi:MAG TPA: patatin-like phospholipase family protein [Thermodesulfovibrionales bacterium]|nr:patatin-like phospholipase family protein [Thermodesulfovibrionales bacterium]